MTYKQIYWSNWQNTGYIGGWCLKFVQDAFMTRHQFYTAEEQRQALERAGKFIIGKPPLNIEVPIFFSIDHVPAGHIAIRLADGKVASSSLNGEHSTPYIHDSIEELERFYSTAYRTRYIGWSTELSDRQIVEWVEKPIITKKKDKNMYIINSKELQRNLLVIVDNTGLRLQTFTNADDINNISWGADISRKIHANNNDFCSHFWTYDEIRQYYGDWCNHERFIQDIKKCEKGKHLFYKKPRAINE